MPRHTLPATNRDENVQRRDRLRAEVERIRRDLNRTEHDDGSTNQLTTCVLNHQQWRHGALRALERIEDDLGDIEDWLVDHDRELLQKATKLLQTLADEGCDLEASEYDLVKQLVARQQNP